MMIQILVCFHVVRVLILVANFELCAVIMLVKSGRPYKLSLMQIAMATLSI